MYIRETLERHADDWVKPPYQRKRNVYLNIRMTEDERKRIRSRAETTGKCIQDFVIDSCLDQKIIAIGNVKTFTKFKTEIQNLKNIILKQQEANIDISTLESIRTIMEILDSVKENKEKDEQQKNNR